MRPCFKLFCLGIIAKSFPKFLNNLSLEITTILAKLDAISLLDMLTDLSWKQKSDERTLHVYTLGLATKNWYSLPVQKASAYAQQEWWHLSHKVFCSWGISFREKYSQILYERISFTERWTILIPGNHRVNCCHKYSIALFSLPGSIHGKIIHSLLLRTWKL